MNNHAYVMSTLQVPDRGDAPQQRAWGRHGMVATQNQADGRDAREGAARVWRSVEQHMPWLASIRAVPEADN